MTESYDEKEILDALPPTLRERLGSDEGIALREAFKAFPSDIHVFFPLYNLLEREQGTDESMLEGVTQMVLDWGRAAQGPEEPEAVAGEASTLQDLVARMAAKHHRRSPRAHPQDFLRVLRQHQPAGRHMLRRFGWQSWYSFWYSKLFVWDEGGEYMLLWRWHTRDPDLVKHPYKIEVEHISACNKRCMLCAQAHWKNPPRLMSLEEFRHVVDSFPHLRWINIAGIGSGWLHPEFPDMIRYARSKHINVNFVDEFEHFDEDRARMTIESGVNSVYISMDAAKPETYARIKGGADLALVQRNIRNFVRIKKELKSPVPELHFRFILCTENYKEMIDYLDFIHSLGDLGPRCKVQYIGVISFPGIEPYYLPMEDLPEKMLIDLYRKALDTDLYLEFNHAGTALAPMKACTAWAEPFVMANGNVIQDCAVFMTPDRGRLDDLSFGNIFQQPFTEIWNSPRYVEFRRRVVNQEEPVPEECLTCCAYDIQSRVERKGIAPTERTVSTQARTSPGE